MKLVEVVVNRFRNFVDSTTVSVQPDVTCLVGKNESGKTAFLQALYRLNPARPNIEFHVPDHYPAWLEKTDRLNGIQLEDIMPIRAVLELDATDIQGIEDRFGSGALRDQKVTVARKYDNEMVFEFDINEQAVLQHLLAPIPHPIPERLTKAQDFDTFVSELEAAESEEMSPEDKQSVDTLRKRASELCGSDPKKAMQNQLEKCLPLFFYYHEYSNLPYSVKISRVLKQDQSGLDDHELTARSLLRLAAAEDDYLLNPDYERRKRELENIANFITRDVRTYWTQNPELRVQPDITTVSEATKQGERVALDELKIRIWDDRHSLSLPFDQHSSGFQWFFSFLAAFSEYESRQTPVIILLDEPALGLHGRAQADFLRFIDERLAKRCQVFYTTHSPFMIQPDQLERVRIIEDRGRDEGAKVTQDVLTTDKDTLFPLQGALGYDLAQHLFVAPHNLVVEGTSDYTYLTVVSDFLKNQSGRISLDDRWSVVPVGGADMIPTFVALLGHHLDVTVVIDSQRQGYQRLSRMVSAGLLTEQRIITAGQVTNRKYADVEDLFVVKDYLLLYNRAFGTSLQSSDLAGTDPIVTRIARHLGVDRFDHGRPADIMLRYRDELLPQLSAETLKRFEHLFTMINATLSKET